LRLSSWLKLTEDPTCQACYLKRSEHLPDGACPKIEHSGFVPDYDPEGDDEAEECPLCGMDLESEACNEFPDCQGWAFD
jgi:hypothetical protein